MVGGKTYGYARVSSRDQNLDRQMNAFLEFGIDPSMVYADKMSGKDFCRPEYQRLLGDLCEGDVLVVKSIDRLGRSYEDILEQWRAITKERGASVVVLDMPLLDTRTQHEGVTGALIADIVLQLLSYVAQVERENIRQRQAEGIAAAQARGVRFGRPRKQRPENYGAVKQMYGKGYITRRAAACELGVSPSTLDRWIMQDKT